MISHQSAQKGAQWLTVSQAAALLGVSERTIRRRCEGGKLAARLESTASGPAWLIDADALRTPAANAAAMPADTRPSAPAPEIGNGSALAAANVRTPAANAADAPKADAADQREGDLMAALLAEKDGRIADLQKQLEAANGALEREQNAHSETRRVLAFNMATPTIAASPTRTPEPGNVPRSGVAPTRPPQSPQRRRPRPLWAVLIGYRPKD